MEIKEALLKSVEKIETLKDDWDSYGSPSFSSEVCSSAKLVIEFLPISAFLCNPAIVPCGGGRGINIEFQKNSKELEIEVLKSELEYLKVYKDGSMEEGYSLIDKIKIEQLIQWLVED